MAIEIRAGGLHGVNVLSLEILYPYHFGQTDTSKLVDLLKGAEHIEVRVRKM